MSIKLAELARRFYREARAGGQAKLLGLKYVGFGRYATKEGKIVAISENGKLKFKFKKEGAGDMDDQGDWAAPANVSSTDVEPLPHIQPGQALPGSNQDPEAEPDDKYKGDWHADAKNLNFEATIARLQKLWVRRGGKV